MKLLVKTSALLLGFSLYVACSGTDTVATPNSPPTAAIPSSQSQTCSSTSYKVQIEPLFATKCLSCHGQNSRRGDFSTYSNIQRELNSIKVHALVLQDMPPRNETQLTTTEKADLKCWIDNGAPNN